MGLFAEDASGLAQSTERMHAHSQTCWTFLLLLLFGNTLSLFGWLLLCPEDETRIDPLGCEEG